ncbi:hypothetical protein W97_02840 [Coniosporium apollinis CBS 100218]|uniref:Small ribosomal subunit protein uS4m n=1 Tax=Coniosporium apollinis (strain CBS 100218) TaxID=1168221 RepID=R7YP07_CONA1|nr:uncharacterized protein W97_02840 [Coniosporium apollinis CBS 100218]EON63612.1 hypothetical protein W97_02840 [Coniosporium apollinis CBS 100218]
MRRKKVRQTWNKYNLYNISRMQTPTAYDKTFFQQKWKSKALTRAYHGEQIKEKHWERMFRRSIPAVVPMDHEYLAKHDGSELAAGRGSGLDEAEKGRNPAKTPYMQMTFHPTERRLDTAIFRALFASSARQARQFVTHGFVKVNGKRMIYPGYMLNPGDMFQVDPERVMWATGARKDQDKYETSGEYMTTPEENEPVDEVAEEDEDARPASAESPSTASAADAPEATERTPEELRKELTALMDQAKILLKDPKDLSPKQKIELRSFRTNLKRAISRNKATESEAEDYESQLAALTARLAVSPSSSNSSTSSANTSAVPTEVEDLTKEQAKLLKEALQRAHENPYDPSKPYLTPWAPRPYMSAFAFIPRYLEVSHSICSAVYLRHPVARPGLAEVPTPFHKETNQLAHAWYLRRR